MGSEVLHRRFAHQYPMVDHGTGVYLFDTQGRRILDACGGALVANIGHGVAEVADAIAAQARRVAFAHGTQFSSEALEEYAMALSKVSPVPESRVYLVTGGSGAVETGLKLARQVCIARGEAGRHKVIARWHSYHGATIGALSASGRHSLRAPYSQWLIDMPHIPPAYCYRCPYGHEPVLSPGLPETGCDLACAQALEDEILRQDPETVAAFIAEPVVGAALCAAVPPRKYWTRIRDICSRHGVLLVSDEVMTGFGRTGLWFAVEHWGLTPDILVSAKGASGGYFPLGVVLVGDSLVQDIASSGSSFAHGFTYANSILGAAAGLAVLRYLQARDLVAASARMGAVLAGRLLELVELAHVGDVRGLGLMAGIELVAEKQSKRPFPRSLHVAERVQAAALERGVNVYYGTGMANGVDGDAILLGPPFVVTEEQIAEIVDVLAESIGEVVNGVMH